MRAWAALLLPLALLTPGDSRRPLQVGPTPDGGILLPTRQVIHPAGRSLLFAGRPVDLTLSSGALYAKSDRGLLVIDPRAWIVRQELKFPEGGGSMHGILATRGTPRCVYATTAQDLLWEATVAADGTVAWGRKIVLPGPGGQGSSHPCGMALSPDERTLYVCLSRNNSLGVVDRGSGTLKHEIPVGVAPFDVALSADGRTAYVSDWGGRRPRTGERSAPSSGTETLVDERGVACSGTVSVVDLASGRETGQIAAGLHPSGLALNRAGSRLYVANANSDTVTVISPSEQRVIETAPARPVPGLPFGSASNALALARDEKTLYVADGGNNAIVALGLPAAQGRSVIPRRRPARHFDAKARNGRKREIEFTTETRRHGGGQGGRRRRWSGGISRRGPTSPWYPAALFRSVSPCLRGEFRSAFALSPVSRFRVKKTKHAFPSAGRGRLHVEGCIPTAWYPGAIVTDGRYLYVANIKGVGARHKEPGQRGWKVSGQLGSITRMEIPSSDALRSDTARACSDARLSEALRAAKAPAGRDAPFPFPDRSGRHSVFRHVVYIIKENRTYDQLFGDLPHGNNDPALCVFGREVTPNHHALAEQFALLDDFYCNGTNSADGHSWATEGNVTDHLEKSFGGFTRSYTFGDDPLTYSSSGFIWDNVLRHGLTFRNYGEMDYAEPAVKEASFKEIYGRFLHGADAERFSQNIGIATLRAHSCRNYPGWNLKIPDVLRAERFLQELRDFEKKGEWPDFILLYLPNDHTSGTGPGAPTPRAQVADNDRALGRVVEGISRSRFWPATCLFVVEDDPQDGFDHVDGHRSICLVISPYTRRGAVVSQFYNQTSVLHTMERILGLPPVNQMDAMAPLMGDCFTRRSDLRPYTSLPNRIPLDEMNPPLARLRGPALAWAKKSRDLPLDRPDEADDETLNRVIWHSAKGEGAAYPGRGVAD